ncbi:MAG: YncE family protein [bacterium]|nr:YncE family protein [bacterium]
MKKGSFQAILLKLLIVIKKVLGKRVSLGLLLMIFISGCFAWPRESTKDQRLSDGTLRLFLQFSCPGREEISFTVSQIQAHRADGEVIFRTVDQVLQAGGEPRQVIITVNLPTGAYQKIGLSFAGAKVQQPAAGVIPLETPQEPTFLDLDIPLLISPRKVISAHLNLEVRSQSMDKDEAKGRERVLFSSRLSQGKRSTALKSLMLYVTNMADNTVSVLDRVNNSLVSVIQVGKEPQGIVVNEQGTYAYVANAGSNTVSIIDTLTGEVDETVDLPLGIYPSGITITSDGKYVLVANRDSDNVTVIDTDLKRSIYTFRVGHKPIDLRVSPATGRWLYVTNQGSRDLYIVSLESRKLVDRVPLQAESSGIAAMAVNFAQDRLFIADPSSSAILVLDIDLEKLHRQEQSPQDHFSPGHSVIKSSLLQGEYGPVRIVLDEDRGRLYAANQKDNSVSSFPIALTSMNIQESRYQVGQKPIGLALDKARNYLYVVNSADDSLSIIDLRQERVVESIRVGRKPFGIDLIQK